MMEANSGKFQAIFPNQATSTGLSLNDSVVTSEEHVKLLGVNIDYKLNFNHHIHSLCKKAGAQLNVLQRLSGNLDQKSRMAIFRCFILSHFSYCSLGISVVK